MSDDPRIAAIPDIHGHAKGEHKPYADERPIALSARMLFLWFYHACRRGAPRFLMVADHMNYLTFEDPAAVNLVRRALKLAAAGDLYGAAETASVDVAHAAVVCDGLRRGMRYSIGAEVDNDPRSRPDAQNIVDAMRPDGMIRSVHFLTIEHPVHGPNWNWAFDNPEFSSLYDHVGVEKTWELYMATLLDAIERLPGHIVGHFYVPANFGHWPEETVLEGYEDRMLDAVAARGMAVELNTRFLYRDHPEELKERYLAANLRLLKKAKARGIGIAVGSDAHSPRDQGAGFDRILRLLDEAEINELVFPIAGRLARVALRATKEHLEQHAATSTTVVPGSSITGYSRAELGLEAVRPAEKPAPRERAARERAAKAAAEREAGSEPEQLLREVTESASADARPAGAEEPPKPARRAPAPKTAAAKAAPKPAPAAKALPAKVPKALPADTSPPKPSEPPPKPAPKPPAKEPPARAAAKAPVKKASAKPAAKAPAKKTAAKKKAPAKKAPVRLTKARPAAKAAKSRPAARKKAAAKAAKRAPARKKSPAKKAPVKKPASKRR